MSRIIKITPELLEECRADFEKALTEAKLSDGKLTFSKVFNSKTEQKATIYFSELAWLKMTALIREFSTEVAWHGTAVRGENNDYHITDIMVYPQEVSGATVTTDQERYESWLYCHDDDVFNNIRMQGHSHVNMGTTPSGVDTALYDGILNQLDDSMFYIFMIWNKRGEKTIKIYDLAKNVMFDTSDITVKILDDGPGIEKFLLDSFDMVKEKKYTPAYTGSQNGSTYKSAGAYNPLASSGKGKSAEKADSGKKKSGIDKGWKEPQTSFDDLDDEIYDKFGILFPHGSSKR